MAMTALDYEGIRQLLARYSVALDLGDVPAFQACFAPDGYFAETGLPLETPEGRFEGRKSIGEFAAHFIANAQGHIRHWSSPPLIEGDGHDATGFTFLMVLRPGSSPGTGVILTGVYRDRYTKIDERWHFAAREFTADPQPEHRGTSSRDPLVARFDDFVAGRSRS
ncbi:nuclear transport factor 2 family protein [Streptosporangium sp. 'caverna']|uniref:nuclear transport factor 2 family protein n=1 Tax=Streptosporangium sp. 'caverna' TaxID=2202249 RepID=UPI0013A6AFB4|nr:nuclear transport factor 2 family protein [Streptosporangium sp. 'caverna']